MNHQPLWPRIARRAKRLLYYPLDTYDLLTGNRPPDEMIFTGDGSWRAVGNEFLHHFRTLGRLEPHHNILDVGCGIGRMAAPLTRYVDGRGSYHGFDIVQRGVDWCTKNITRRHPNFTFTHSDVFNKHYNPSGTKQAATYVFPYGDKSFDFVFLTSVFTHMFPADMENYLHQIARVMKVGGRCLITFFLMNEETRDRTAKGKPAFIFQSTGDRHYVADPNDPEAAIAFDESYVRTVFTRHGLTIAEPISYGSWSGRPEYVSFQDIIVARKT